MIIDVKVRAIGDSKYGRESHGGIDTEDFELLEAFPSNTRPGANGKTPEAGFCFTENRGEPIVRLRGSYIWSDDDHMREYVSLVDIPLETLEALYKAACDEGVIDPQPSQTNNVVQLRPPQKRV